MLFYAAACHTGLWPSSSRLLDDNVPGATLKCSQSCRATGPALHILYFKPGHVKTGQNNNLRAGPSKLISTPPEKTVCRDNKRADITTAGVT